MSGHTDTGQTETVGTTLSGSELAREDDPHQVPDTGRGTNGSSLYPLELGVGFNCQLQRDGRTFVSPWVEQPMGRYDLPSSRHEEIRITLRKRFGTDAPPIGRVGTVTVTETDHHIKLDSADDRDAVPYAQWLFETVYKFVSGIPPEAFSDEQNTVSADAVNEVESSLLNALPGDLVPVGGDCRECGDHTEELRYLRPDQDQALAMCDDCGVGTSYPRLDRNSK